MGPKVRFILQMHPQCRTGWVSKGPKLFLDVSDKVQFCILLGCCRSDLYMDYEERSKYCALIDMKRSQTPNLALNRSIFCQIKVQTRLWCALKRSKIASLWLPKGPDSMFIWLMSVQTRHGSLPTIQKLCLGWYEKGPH